MTLHRTIAAAALACGIVTSALCQTASARPLQVNGFGPIQVDSCIVGRDGSATRGLDIIYHNTRRMAADKVIFNVDYRGINRTISDAGTFSQYASINHGFDVFDGFGYEGAVLNRCDVTYVHFADGEVWRL
jgi:hypothetical protein